MDQAVGFTTPNSQRTFAQITRGGSPSVDINAASVFMGWVERGAVTTATNRDLKVTGTMSVGSANAILRTRGYKSIKHHLV